MAHFDEAGTVVDGRGTPASSARGHPDPFDALMAGGGSLDSVDDHDRSPLGRAFVGRSRGGHPPGCPGVRPRGWRVRVTTR